MNLNEKMLSYAPMVKEFRERLLADPYRPMYHFAVPEGIGIPGDPNGAFYANGRYHLMYLYRHEQKGFCWGHISSTDLVHFRHHPDAITTGANSRGCFSGGALVDDDGKAYISFWDFVVADGEFGGLRIAVSDDDNYERWEILPEYAVKCEGYEGTSYITTEKGERVPVCAADPSNIWKQNGKYYMQAGNLLLLNNFGRQEDSPIEMRGDWVDLFSSNDLHNWKCEHRFYKRDITNCWTDETEDDMCPSFLPLPITKEGGELSDKYLQLFISHNKGCQYYIGSYDKQKNLFLPEKHGRMTWEDNTYFAPEALLDNNSRQIMWAWLLDNPGDDEERGWSGVFGLPRTLWLDSKTEALRMAPVPELCMLRYNPKTFNNLVIGKEPIAINGIDGTSCELLIKADIPKAAKLSIKLRISESGDEYVNIGYDDSAKQLTMDTRNCGKLGRPMLESAPFTLVEGEKLSLNIFVDKSVIEVYANERQAICRRAYPCQNGTGITISADCYGVKADIQAWNIDAANAY